jgi:hypothetical protein
MHTIKDRARLLIDMAGFTRLIREGDISVSRWQSVRYKDIRMSTEELEVLQRMFPEHALWLVSGRVAPECGQTAPVDRCALQ